MLVKVSINHAYKPASASIRMRDGVTNRSITFDAICEAKMPGVTYDSTHRSMVGRYDAYRQLAKVR